MGVRHKTVKGALEWVAKHPMPPPAPIEAPIWELVARQLFQSANQVGGTRQEMKATNAASKIIFDRMVGKRKAGTHPAMVTKQKIDIVDFTQKPEVGK